MKIKQKCYCAPSRETADLAAVDLAEIRAAGSGDDAVRVFQRFHERRVAGYLTQGAGLHVSSGGCLREEGGGLRGSKHGDWCAVICINKKEYRTPLRATRELALADLAQIRVAASRGEAFRLIVRLRKGCMSWQGSAGASCWARLKGGNKNHSALRRSTRVLVEVDIDEIGVGAIGRDVVRAVPSLQQSRVKRRRVSVSAAVCDYATVLLTGLDAL